MKYDDVTTNPIWRTAAILKIVLSAGNHPISTKFGRQMQIVFPRSAS